MTASPSHAVEPARLNAAMHVIRRFSPNWFSCTMGTGIMSAVLMEASPFLEPVATSIWVANAALFAVLAASMILQRFLFPARAAEWLDHETAPLFLGCIPMGLATIINGILAFGMPIERTAAVDTAVVLWILDVILALAFAVSMPYRMFTRHDHSLNRMTAVWLLPVVAAEVAAVSGALIAPHLPSASLQLSALVVSYVLWAWSVPLAAAILSILLLRLASHKLPESRYAASCWLPLGPLATGALALMRLGEVAPPILAANGLDAYSSGAASLGFFGGLILWGSATWWAALAVVVTIRHLRDGAEFNLGWWGYTFPIGVYAVCTFELAHRLSLPWLHWLALIVAVGVSLIWLVVTGLTLNGGWCDILSARATLRPRSQSC